MRSKKAVTQFALVRHAETHWNREKRIQGQKDSALTTEGHRQAVSWGRSLSKYHLDHLVSSDLGRAALTATLMNQRLQLSRTVLPGLREQDWGQWSGLKFTDLNAVDLQAQEKKGWHFRPAGGESRLQVLERSRAALEDLARHWKGRRILVVTHGGVIKCLLYRLTNRRFLPDEPTLLKPYRLHWIAYDGESLAVQQLNVRI